MLLNFIHIRKFFCLNINKNLYRANINSAFLKSQFNKTSIWQYFTWLKVNKKSKLNFCTSNRDGNTEGKVTDHCFYKEKNQSKHYCKNIDRCLKTCHWLDKLTGGAINTIVKRQTKIIYFKFLLQIKLVKDKRFYAR